jgi:uncharacterized protein YycO
MSAGDVLLFSRKITPAAFKADPFGTTMCALIHLTTRSKWNHAALDIGDGMMVEATSKGVAVNPIRSSDEIRAIYMGADDFDNPTFACKPCSLIGYYGNDLEEVLAWSTGRVGWRYGTLNAFWCGLRNLFPGIAHVKHGKTIICSELVAEALARAGHDFDKDYALVSPGDLAEHFGVNRR